MSFRVLFVIRSLNAGGAERQLIDLAAALRNEFSISICTFYEHGQLIEDAKRIEGVQLFSLRKRSRWDVRSFLRIRDVVHRVRPHVVHGYMAVANELALIAARIAGVKAIWGLRSSYMDLARYGVAPRAAFQLGRAVSPWADFMISNSVAGKSYHVAHGYPADKIAVIPNGIDTHRFSPHPDGGSRLRAQWKIARHEKLIGLVARIDPIKDHETFLQAASVALKSDPSLRFACIGGGPDQRLTELQALAARLGITDRLIWSGHVDDMAAAYSALDLCTLTSYGEGFPNALAEAMACGTPCVATDAGDSRIILGDLGLIAPTRAPKELASAWLRMLERTHRPDDAQDLRQRIVRNFSVELLRSRTADVLRTQIGLRLA